MTKTPLISRFAFGATAKKFSSTLKEPFLSPADGKLHTTSRLERSQMCLRWMVLWFVSFLMSCNYYCYDNPAALNKPLAIGFSDVPNYHYYYDMFYSIYSIPNMLLPMLGGVLVDKAGLYFSLNLFSCFILVGQVVFAIGCSVASLDLMLLGALLHGAPSALFADPADLLCPSPAFSQGASSLGWAARTSTWRSPR